MQTVQAEVRDYLDVCRFRRKLDFKTVKAYRIDLRQFCEFLERRELPISKELLEAYIEELNRTFRPKSVKRKLAALKAFFRYLEDEEILPDNPFQKLKVRIHEPKTLPRVVPFHVIEAMLQAAYEDVRTSCGNQQSTAVRDAAVMEMLFATGVRVSELCGLNVNDVDIEAARVMVWGKGAKERVLYIGNPEVCAILRRYLDASERTETMPLFLNRCGKRLSEQSVRGILRKYERQAVSALHVTPHMLRHSFATLLLEEGVDIRYIQKMLGHSSIVTTQIYTDVAIGKQREILTQMHPRNRIHMREKRDY